MIQDILCLLRYGKTRFGLLEKYNTSIMRIANDGDIDNDINKKEWSACSEIMEFNYGHDGIWAEGKTPFEAMINCIEELKNKK